MRSFVRSWIPNFISFLAILAGVGLLYVGLWSGDLAWALWCARVGAILQVADGFAADRLKAYHKLGENLGSAAGLALGVGMVATLVRAGMWPWWFALCLAVLAGLLQVVSWQQARWPRLKWVQHWLHPLLSVGVLVVGIVTLEHLVQTSWVVYTLNVMWLFLLLTLAVALRQKHLHSLFNWKPEAVKAD